jgi:predicted kinase
MFDSLTLHLDSNGELEFGRTLLHAAIMQELLDDHARHEEPSVVFMAGGPASGKTTLAVQLALPNDAVYINPDEIRERLPEYEMWKEERPDDAARLTHREASDLAKRTYALALARGHNVVYDAVGGDDSGGFTAKVEAAIARGQRVRIAYATVPVEVALERENARFKEKRRRVPEPVLRNGHAEASRGLATVSRLSVAQIEVYDTSENPGRLIAAGEGGRGLEGMRAVDPPGYAAFLEKGEA